jgi:hypothetical protein
MKKSGIKKIAVVLAAMSIVYVMVSCNQSKQKQSNVEPETVEVILDIYKLKVSAFQELPDTANNATFKQVQITFDYISDSENTNGVPMDELKRQYSVFRLIDSNGNIFTPLDNVSYKIASISFSTVTGGFIELLSSFDLTYNIPESISINDLLLNVYKQFINLDKLQK